MNPSNINWHACVALANRTLKSSSKHKQKLDNFLSFWNQLPHSTQSSILDNRNTTSVDENLIKAAFHLPNQCAPDAPTINRSVFETANLSKFVADKTRHVPFNTIGADLGALRVRRLNAFTGSGGYIFMGDFARLEYALVDYALKFLRHRKFRLFSVPELIDPDTVEMCGFETAGPRTQVYHVLKRTPSELGRVLIGTAEMALAGLYRGERLIERDLPVRLCAHSKCYRAETGEATHERNNIYRVHQFDKVEMFALTRGSVDSSEHMLNEFVSIQKELYDSLEIDYKVLDMASDELGLSAYHKFDIECWMPAQRFFGELSSASNCTDYQARRLDIHLEDASSKRNLDFVHTVNGTACAVPRLMMSIVETNYDESSVTVRLPKVLQPYFGGRTHIGKHPNSDRQIIVTAMNVRVKPRKTNNDNDKALQEASSS